MPALVVPATIGIVLIRLTAPPCHCRNPESLREPGIFLFLRDSGQAGMTECRIWLVNSTGQALQGIQRLACKFLLQDVVDDLRVCLAFCRLHDLAHEEADKLLVAPSETFDLIRALCDNLVDRLFYRPGVADLHEAFLLYDGFGILPGSVHLLEDRLGDLPADRA